MTCQELSEVYELYTLGALEAEEKTEMEAHLARSCEVCTKGIANALVLNASLLSIVPEVAPPSRLKRRVMATVGVEKPGWGWVWALASGCLLILAMWLGYQERDRATQLEMARKQVLDVQAERDKLNQALAFLSEPDTQPASFGKGQTAPPRGYVFVHPRLGVMLIAQNLPAAGAGKIYQMWVIPKGGAPRPAGLFQAEGNRAVHMLNGPIDVATLGVIAVTLEPEAGSAAPTTTPIIAAPLS